MSPRSYSKKRSLRSSYMSNNDMDSCCDTTMITSHWKGSSFDPEMIWETAQDEEIILKSLDEETDWCESEDDSENISSCSAIEELLLLQQQQYSSSSQERGHDRKEMDNEDDDDMWSTETLPRNDSSFGVTSFLLHTAEFDDDNLPRQQAVPQDIIGRSIEMPTIAPVEDEDDDDDHTDDDDHSDTSSCSSSISMSTFYSAVSSTTSASLALGTFEDAEEESYHDDALASVEAEIQAALAQLNKKIQQLQLPRKASCVIKQTHSLSSSRRQQHHLHLSKKLNMVNYRFMSLFGAALMLSCAVVC